MQQHVSEKWLSVITGIWVTAEILFFLVFSLEIQTAMGNASAESVVDWFMNSSVTSPNTILRIVIDLAVLVLLVLYAKKLSPNMTRSITRAVITLAIVGGVFYFWGVLSWMIFKPSASASVSYVASIPISSALYSLTYVVGLIPFFPPTSRPIERWFAYLGVYTLLRIAVPAILFGAITLIHKWKIPQKPRDNDVAPEPATEGV